MTNIFRKNKLLVKYEYFLSGTSTPPRMILDSIKKIKFSMDLCKLQASTYTFKDDTTVSVYFKRKKFHYKRLTKAYNITRLTSRNSTYKKISDFISELLVKYSKTNIFCAECFLHACQVFDWPCEDMSDKVLQTFDVRWQSSLYDKLLIHRSVLMHSCPWRLWLMRLPEFYG